MKLIDEKSEEIILRHMQETANYIQESCLDIDNWKFYVPSLMEKKHFSDAMEYFEQSLHPHNPRGFSPMQISQDLMSIFKSQLQFILKKEKQNLKLHLSYLISAHEHKNNKLIEVEQYVKKLKRRIKQLKNPDKQIENQEEKKEKIKPPKKIPDWLEKIPEEYKYEDRVKLKRAREICIEKGGEENWDEMFELGWKIMLKEMESK